MPFDPLSLLAGAPSFQGGPAGPAFSDADSGNVSAIFSAPFIVGDGNTVAGEGQGVGSVPLVLIALIAGVAWIVVNR